MRKRTSATTKHSVAVVLLLFCEVVAVLDPKESSMKARLMRLAENEREISASFRGTADLQPKSWGQQVQPQFLATAAGQWSPATVSLMHKMNALPVGTQLPLQRSAASLAEGASKVESEPTTPTPAGGGACSPACKEGQGICVNAVCLCRGPWSGESCEVAEATGNEIPFEKDAQKIAGAAGSDIGEALKSTVAMPFAIFIWTTVVVLTFFCTALCPQICGRRSGGPDATAGYADFDLEKEETQYDIVEAWAIDSRKRKDRDEQNESERRTWFEDTVGQKLRKIEWPHVH